MKRLKLEPKDIESLGFEKEYEIGDQFKFNKGDKFIIRINGTQFEAHRFDPECPFVFTCPVRNMSTELLRNILKWNADVLYN